MNDLENLMIYKQYLEMLYYIETITEKYPKVEKYSMVAHIKTVAYNGMELIIDAQKEYNQYERIKILNRLDSKLKMLKVMVRISNKKKYISSKNYEAWSKKITNVSNLLGGWIKSCQRR